MSSPTDGARPARAGCARSACAGTSSRRCATSTRSPTPTRLPRSARAPGSRARWSCGWRAPAVATMSAFGAGARRPGPFRPRVLAQPAARPLADLVPRLGAAAADRDLRGHRLSLPRRLLHRISGDNSVTGPGRLGSICYFFDWPTAPAWLYALTQGLHVVSGARRDPDPAGEALVGDAEAVRVAAVRSPAHALERLSLALLVGGSLFVFFTGRPQHPALLPVELLSFVPAHYYGAFIFLAALGLHLVIKLPVALRAFRERGVLAPLRDDLAHTEPEPAARGHDGPARPGARRRSPAAACWRPSARGSLGLARDRASASRRRPAARARVFWRRAAASSATGPNGFPVNKTAAAVGIEPERTGAGWRLRSTGARRVELSRDELLAMPQRDRVAADRLRRGLVDDPGVDRGAAARPRARSPDATASRARPSTRCSRRGSFSAATLSGGQVADARSLLALRVNGADLSLDHGYPGAGDRPGGARRPLHQVGRVDQLRGGLSGDRRTRRVSRPLRRGPAASDRRARDASRSPATRCSRSPSARHRCRFAIWFRRARSSPTT